MFKMCLNLINSQYKGIDEVEYLLNNETTEEEIIKAKDNRKEINRLLSLAESNEYLEALGI